MSAVKLATGKLSTGKLSPGKLVNVKLSTGKIVKWEIVNWQIVDWQKSQLTKWSTGKLSPGKVYLGKWLSGNFVTWHSVNWQIVNWQLFHLAKLSLVTYQKTRLARWYMEIVHWQSASGKVPNINIVFLGEQSSALLSALGSLFSLVLVIIFVPEINKQIKPKESNLLDLKKV